MKGNSYKGHKRHCYKKVYGNKLDKLEVMDTLLDIHTLLRLNYEEIENQDRLITSNEIE
jgi:hypothetical protein